MRQLVACEDRYENVTYLGKNSSVGDCEWVHNKDEAQTFEPCHVDRVVDMLSQGVMENLKKLYPALVTEADDIAYVQSTIEKARKL